MDHSLAAATSHPREIISMCHKYEFNAQSSTGYVGGLLYIFRNDLQYFWIRYKETVAW